MSIDQVNTKDARSQNRGGLSFKERQARKALMTGVVANWVAGGFYFFTGWMVAVTSATHNSYDKVGDIIFAGIAIACGVALGACAYALKRFLSKAAGWTGFVLNLPGFILVLIALLSAVNDEPKEQILTPALAALVCGALCICSFFGVRGARALKANAARSKSASSASSGDRRAIDFTFLYDAGDGSVLGRRAGRESGIGT